MDAINNQLANIVTILLQTEETYRTQIGRDIYNISEELRNIIHRDMEWQSYYIQALIANDLDWYKGKGNKRVDKYIK